MNASPQRSLWFWLALSIAINLWLCYLLLSALSVRATIQKNLVQTEQTVHNLYRVLPKTFYTRNTFAAALAMPGGIPTVNDCLVRFGDDVFVFDRTNTLIGLYSPGPNPFVPEEDIDANYKCHVDLLDAQTKRRREHYKDYEDRFGPNMKRVKQMLDAKEPWWSQEGGFTEESPPLMK